ncbi:LPS assembly protein LptD [Candidatus Halobeggiatoa sp. HSG11]|nr:LPS assembly protein LptD [Candidatus Halobeggiatoa sp. HSG11]
MRFNQIIIFLLSITIIVPVVANEFKICRPFNDVAPPRPVSSSPINNTIQIEADDVIVQEKLGTSTFSGDVFLQRAEQILITPHATYDHNNDIINANQKFNYWDKNFIISGSSIKLQAKKHGIMSDVKYWLLNRRARGQAKKIIKESEDIIHLEQTRYTTCDSHKEIWYLSANAITLNNLKEEGTATHATVRLLGVPIFYFPYLSFPIGDKRKSGFLAPSMGSSDETGTEFSIPYYLNLAPNYDATITPRIMSRRGVLMETEFRYLTAKTKGQLEVEYLPNDSALGKDRSFLVFKHKGYINKNWLASFDINKVSDGRYFEELGTNLSVASITHLEQRGDLYYIGNGWLGIGRVQKFQTLSQNPAARPYHRLPQLLFQTKLPEVNKRLNVKLNAELVRFDRDIEIVNAPVGNRLDLKSSLSWPQRTPGTFIVPKLSLRYTSYDLDNVKTNESNPERLLYTFSTDSGLFFERNVFNLVQTLEPRVFYRYTPYKDQSNIPIFDTARYDLSFSQLFRDNNFSGADRVDDSHQVSLGITSRLLNDKTGTELLQLSVGEAFYFKNRQVTLSNKLQETDPSSNVIVELASQFSKNWRASSTFRFNPHDNNTEHTVIRMRYNSNSERVLNLSYRLRGQDIEQTDVSFYWRLDSRWRILGRWNYSLPDDKTLETFSGIEYSSCCWAIRGITRRYLNSTDGSGYLNGFFIQFQLKGLGNVGSKTDSFLEERIPGYYDNF